MMTLTKEFEERIAELIRIKDMLVYEEAWDDLENLCDSLEQSLYLTVMEITMKNKEEGLKYLVTKYMNMKKDMTCILHKESFGGFKYNWVLLLLGRDEISLGNNLRKAIATMEDMIREEMLDKVRYYD